MRLLYALAASSIVSLVFLVGVCALWINDTALKRVTIFFVAFAAGGFIYVASCDLIPELHKETDGRKSAFTAAIFVLGILLMYILTVCL